MIFNIYITNNILPIYDELDFNGSSLIFTCLHCTVT